MSQLSKLFHKGKSEVLRQAVQYLEKIDLPKATKATIAVGVMKAFHIGEGNQWSDEVENAVMGAIDYILGEIRYYAVKYNSPVSTPEPVPAAENTADTDSR